MTHRCGLGNKSCRAGRGEGRFGELPFNSCHISGILDNEMEAVVAVTRDNQQLGDEAETQRAGTPITAIRSQPQVWTRSGASEPHQELADLKHHCSYWASGNAGPSGFVAGP